MSLERLAVDGGRPARSKPWPVRGLLGAEEKAAVDALFDEAIRSGRVIGYNGPEEEAFCREFADSMGGGYADAVNSGTSGIYCALRALGVEPFTEVIVSVITDPGGMMPIPLLNCIPVIADTTRDSYNTAGSQVEPLVTPLTSAIVVAHIGGEPCGIEGIMEVARRHDLPVVEDCAQAHLAKMNGRPVGTFGDVAVFSTMFGKHFSTGGQGGLVFTRNEELYQRVRRASDRGKPFGLPEGSTNQVAALNLNLNDLAATIGRVQLRKLGGIVRRRREIVAGLREGLGGLKAVAVPDEPPGAEGSYWFLRMRFDGQAVSVGKDEFLAAVEAEGLSPIIRDYAAHTPHRYEWFTKRRVFGTSGYPWTSPDYTGDPDREFACPNSLFVSRTNFNLQILESWGDEEIDDCVRIFSKVESAYAR